MVQNCSVAEKNGHVGRQTGRRTTIGHSKSVTVFIGIYAEKRVKIYMLKRTKKIEGAFKPVNSTFIVIVK